MTQTRDIRQVLLKPLVRRKPNMADEKALLSAYKRLDEIAFGSEILINLTEIIATLGSKENRSKQFDPEHVKKQTMLTRALYLSRQLSKSEFVFLAVYPVENIHAKRISDGEYDSELKPISDAMLKIERNHGLRPHEFFKLTDAPLEYKKLDIKWNIMYNRLFIENLIEFGLDDIAELMQDDPAEYKRLRERGRRASAHKNEIENIIRDIVVRMEKEAKRAAAAKAYTPAVVSLGAGLEGLLLLRCLRSKHKAIRVAKNLKRTLRPRFPNDLTTWTFQNLIEVCLDAGWLPTVSTEYAQYKPEGLANLLRTMRNNIHPGRFAKYKPWSEISERDYKDVYSIYLILMAKLAKIGKRKLKSLSDQ